MLITNLDHLVCCRNFWRNINCLNYKLASILWNYFFFLCKLMEGRKKVLKQMMFWTWMMKAEPKAFKRNVKWSAANAFGLNLINIFTLSFYARRSRKRKKTYNKTVFFTLLGSARVKAVRRTLMKLTPGFLTP